MEENKFNIEDWLREAAEQQAPGPAGDAVKQQAWQQLHAQLETGVPFFQRWGWVLDAVVLVSLVTAFVWHGSAYKGTIAASDGMVKEQDIAVADKEAMKDQHMRPVNDEVLKDADDIEMVKDSGNNVREYQQIHVPDDGIAKKNNTNSEDDETTKKTFRDDKALVKKKNKSVANDNTSIKEDIVQRESSESIDSIRKAGTHQTIKNNVRQDDLGEIQKTPFSTVPILPYYVSHTPDDALSASTNDHNISCKQVIKQENLNAFSLRIAAPLPVNGAYGLRPAVEYNYQLSQKLLLRPFIGALYIRDGGTTYTHNVLKPRVDTIPWPGTPYIIDSLQTTNKVTALLYGTAGIQASYRYNKLEVSIGVAYYHLLAASSKMTDSTSRSTLTLGAPPTYQRDPFRKNRLPGGRNVQLQFGVGYMILPRLQTGLQYNTALFKSAGQKGLKDGAPAAPGTSSLEVHIRWFLW